MPRSGSGADVGGCHRVRSDPSGLIIEELVVALNGKPIIQGDCSPGLARNPYLMFRVRGAMPGDTLRLSWKDSHGASDSHEVALA